jgi:hypothetical protein
MRFPVLRIFPRTISLSSFLPDLLLARHLVGLLIGLGELCGDPLTQPFAHGLDFGRRRGDIQRLLGASLGQADDEVNHRLHLFVAKGDRAQHDLFREFLGLGLDHQHAVARAGHDQVQLGGWEFVLARVEQVFAVFIPDPATADRPEERQARYGQRRRAADHRRDVGVVFQVVAEHGADDLGFIPIALGEKRPDRTVDEPGGQGLLLRWPALALEEAARNLASGKGLFLVVHGEREEVDALPRFPGADSGAEHHRIAIGDDDRAIGLPGDSSGLEHQRAPAPVDFLAKDVKHAVLVLPTSAVLP